MRWMRMRLMAPLAAFGGTTTGARGVTRNMPARSMLTGLFANALGWTRAMRAEHQMLQDRLVHGVLWESDPGRGRMIDYQTARLNKTDRAWTTRGAPAGRAGSPHTYAGAHQRWRHYHADLRMHVVVRLEPAAAAPTLDTLASALDQPARPLCIGRKTCLPACRLFAGWVEARDVRAALADTAPADGRGLAFWPETEGTGEAHRVSPVTDERNWASGLHGGERLVCEGPIVAAGREA